MQIAMKEPFVTYKIDFFADTFYSATVKVPMRVRNLRSELERRKWVSESLALGLIEKGIKWKDMDIKEQYACRVNGTYGYTKDFLGIKIILATKVT